MAAKTLVMNSTSSPAVYQPPTYASDRTNRGVAPTVKISSTVTVTRYADGTPVPLPRSMAAGALPAVAVNGAAAEMTMIAMLNVPNGACRRPCSRRAVSPLEGDVVGAHNVLRLLCGAFRIVAGPLEWVLGRRWARP